MKTLTNPLTRARAKNAGHSFSTSLKVATLALAWFAFMPASPAQVTNFPGISLTEIGNWQWPTGSYDFARAIAVAGNYAYLAADRQNLIILDVSNPSFPSKVSSVPGIGAFSVAVEGSVAYVAETNALRLVDISNPGSPRTLGTAALECGGVDIHVVGHYAYVPIGLQDYGLAIVNVSNPTNPQVAGRIQLPMPACSVRVLDTVAYVAAGDSLMAVDVSDPARLRVLGSLRFREDAPVQVRMAGRRLYVVCYEAGLQVIDPANPADLRVIGSYKAPYMASACDPQGDLVFLSYLFGLQVVDFANPADPQLQATLDVGVYMPALQVVSNRVYAAADGAGLKIFQWERGLLSQNLIFTLPGTVPLTNSPLTLTATASSGLPVEFSVISGPAYISTNRLFLLGPGLVTVRATQAGNAFYQAVSAEQTIEVTDLPIPLECVAFVRGWGSDLRGEISVPPGLSNVVGLAAGDEFSLALKSNGTIAAWGWNYYGQTQVPFGLTNVVAIAAGGEHALALTPAGTVVAWGSSSSGATAVPTGLSNVVAIAAGAHQSLALRRDGTVTAWGSNYFGSTPQLSNIVAVAAGKDHNLALKADGKVLGWSIGSLGDQFGETHPPPELTNAVAIDAGDYHSLALTRNGTVVAWGHTTYGETDVPKDLTNVVAISAGAFQNLALKSDGTVVAWGGIGFGLGIVPPDLTNVSIIAAGGEHNLALATVCAPRPGILAVTPLSQDFGAVPLGTNVERTFFITNTGGLSLIGNASVPAPFSIVSGGSYNLSASRGQSVVVRYSPTAAGTNYGSLTFTGGGGASCALSGSAYDPAQVDLVLFRPSGWNDLLPIGALGQPGATNHSYSGLFLTNQTLLFSFAVTNAGQQEVGWFTIRAEVSGPAGRNWSWQWAGSSNPRTLNWADQVLGPLPAGSYTFKLYVDYLNQIAERNETNNYYERTIQVIDPGLLADLTPGQPTNWNSMLPVSTTRLLRTNTHNYSGVFYDNTPLFVNWHSRNQGGSNAPSYRVRLEVTGSGQTNLEWWAETLPGSFSSLVEDAPIGRLSAGYHTLKLYLDYYNTVLEADEANNYFERTIYVYSAPPTLSVTPTNLDFGGVQIGMTAERVLHLTNAGSSTLTGSAYLTGSTAPFSIVSGASYTLGAGQGQTMVVRYSPTLLQTNLATLYCAVSAGTGTTVPIRAVAYAPPGGIWPTQTNTSGYSRAGGSFTVNCALFHPGRTLLSLLWHPVLPADCALANSVTGDGSPEVQGGDILFLGTLTADPIRFSYTVVAGPLPPGVLATNRWVAGRIEYQFSDMINPATVMAVPDPLLVKPWTYHAADFRDPRWVIDGTEMSRVLGYWRAGSYHLESSGVDGYAAYAGNTNGFRHSADYRQPYWVIDGSELNRVLSYWRAGAYHPDLAGMDGFAPGTNAAALLLATAPAKDFRDPVQLRQEAPAIYLPGQLIQITNRISYSEPLLSLLARPRLPAGWTLESGSGTGAPELVNGELVWTAALPSSPVEVIYTVRVPLNAAHPQALASEVEFQTVGMPNPGMVVADASRITPFQIERVLKSQDGSISVYLPPALAAQCDLQVSDDLVTWQTLTNATVEPDGNVVFVDRPEPKPSRRFYRAVLR